MWPFTERSITKSFASYIEAAPKQTTWTIAVKPDMPRVRYWSSSYSRRWKK